MKEINYNNISAIYDDVRGASAELIKIFLQEVCISKSSRILDIGCGTANHTDLIQKITGAQVCGIDPSYGMLSKAKKKNTRITFKKGNAGNIPFEENYFDFIFMTDVIHHVPNIKRMFAEIYRVLRQHGKVCIVTESHEQIEKRGIVKFFPATARVDKDRYPDIDEIVETAELNKLRLIKKQLHSNDNEVELGEAFLGLVKRKGYSMLPLITEEEYRTGLRCLEDELKNGTIKSCSPGETLIWLRK